MIRILCIGNRYLDADAAGLKVYDYLLRQTPPDHIEISEGGVAGLNLLGLIDGMKRVVFVDAVSGYAPGGVIVLRSDEIPLPETVYDHAAGLPYLLNILPHVCDRGLPEVYLVGIEGPVNEAIVAEAAQLSIEIASAGEAVVGITDHGPLRRNP